MMRRLFLICTLALVMVGCEDGEFTPVDSPNGGGTQEVLLELTSPEPLTAGDPFTVRATVTENGEPVVLVDVDFTAVNGISESRPVIPSVVQTALILGTAETTVSTAVTDRSITVTASSGTASDVKIFTLVAR
ncbi:MAG: hypothetical protein E2P03_09765 [Acidobacteria bacterium]|nr:MAG: hypothetical protein E2P03_09765 [Acidobacteriota bacterium]